MSESTTEASPPPLELLPLDPGRVLAIVAHPDDLEYGAAAAIAGWTAAGHQVVYCLVTRGEAGIDGMPPDESARVRTEEQVASAAVVGVTTVEFLDHPDGMIEAGVALRRDLARQIRRHRPDTVLLMNHHDTWGPGRLNTPDHRNVGRAGLDAIGDAGNQWIFREQIIGEGLEPHRARRALVASSTAATHALDVSGSVDAAVASLAEHKAYLEGLGDHPMADPEVLRMWLEMTGLRAGVRAAVAVELYEF